MRMSLSDKDKSIKRRKKNSIAKTHNKEAQKKIITNQSRDQKKDEWIDEKVKKINHHHHRIQFQFKQIDYKDWCTYMNEWMNREKKKKKIPEIYSEYMKKYKMSTQNSEYIYIVQRNENEKKGP